MTGHIATVSVRRRIWWGVALLTALPAVGISGTSLVGALVQRAAYRSDTYTQNVRQLDININAGDVTVQPGPPGQVTVVQTVTWTTTRPTVDVVPDDGTHTLRIRVECDDYGWLSHWGCGVGLSIKVPPQTAIRTIAGSGYTYIAGISGALDLNSTSGSITLQDTTGSVLAATTSGSIEGSRLWSPSMAAGSGSGSMNLSFARPPQDVRLTADSGSVDLLVPQRSRYRVNGYSPSGEVDIAPGIADPSAGGSLSVTTGSGSVSIAYGGASLSPQRQSTALAPPSG